MSDDPEGPKEIELNTNEYTAQWKREPFLGQNWFFIVIVMAIVAVLSFIKQDPAQRCSDYSDGVVVCKNLRAQ